MKVGYIFNHEYILGGGEISFLDLLSEVRQFGVVPVAFLPAKGEISSCLDSKGIEWHEAPWPHLNLMSIPSFFKRITATSRQFSGQNLDLVHVNGARSMLYAGPAAKRIDVPCLWHVRVLERDMILDRIRAHYATEIIANSRAVSASLAAVVGPEKHVDVIYNGFDLVTADKVKPMDLRKEFGLPDAPVVLCVGRFTMEKAFEDAIISCGLLQDKGREVALLMVGESAAEDGKYEQEIRSLAASKGVRNVVFAGWRSNVHSLMKSASVLLLSSHRESFGRIIVEAWISGLPVVSTDCGGPRELIEDLSSGLLIPVGDVKAMAGAIERIVIDKNLAGRLSEAGYEKAKQFSIGRHVEQVMALYRRLVKTS